MYYQYSGRRHVTLKIYMQTSSMGQHVDNELKMYSRIAQPPKRSRNHPGRAAVRTLLDSFDVQGPEDKHRCLVHAPLWQSVLAFLRCNPVERLPAAVLAAVLQRVFVALDYLHAECQIIHTGLCLSLLWVSCLLGSPFCGCHAYLVLPFVGVTLTWLQISRPTT
jgi:serine/threonine-protein kinase SRPK3